MKKKGLFLLILSALIVGACSVGGTTALAQSVSDSDVSSEVSEVAEVPETSESLTESAAAADMTSDVQEETGIVQQEEPLSALADETVTGGQCGDNLTWSLNESTGVLTISGSGTMWDANYYTAAPWYAKRSAIKTVQFEGNVTSIGKQSFVGCTNLAEITIPNTVTLIDDYAFYGCSNLETITISPSVTSISNNAFINCTALKSITVQSGNTAYSSIDGVLFNQSATELVYYPPKRAGADYDVPESVQTIAKNAFYHTSLYIYFYRSDVTVQGSYNFTYSDTLVAPAGSTVEAYAKQYGRKFIPFSGSKIVKAELTQPAQSAETANLSDYKTTVEQGQSSYNIGNHDYDYYWGDTVKSYLQANADGTFSRVENIDSSIVVETYSADFQLKSTKTIALELPIFGGFYSGAKYNFIVCGRQNSDESDEVEVVRVIKYSKSWERLDSKSFYGKNTYIPFDAGTVNMTEDGSNLYIHTAHEMYQSSDGLHHQANMTFYVNQETLEEIYSRSNVAYIGVGYVSHSFNQVIRTAGDSVYTADHGDAYPRSIVIVKKDKEGNNQSYCDILEIQGATGANQTKATLGGMELSDNYVITVGTSVTQDEDYVNRSQKNVFVTLIHKDKLTKDMLSFLWLTNYSENAKITVGNPHLVKINSNRFVIMWEETDADYNKTVKCVSMDGSGQFTSNILSMKADYDTEGLSDCTPIVSGNNIIWYTSGKNHGNMWWYSTKTAPTFYQISSNLSVKTLSAVSVKAKPNKLTYNIGDTLDTTGLTLTAAYSDGSSKEVTNGFTCTPTALNTAGTQKITVTYDGKTASFDVTVKSNISMTKQPANVIAKSGAWITFQVAAEGEGLTYQWQLSDDQGKTWRNSSTKAAAYATTLSDKNNGRYVRCVVTDKYGTQAVSNAASMKITSLKITAQPTNSTRKSGETATFQVTASGEGVTYLWQLSDDKGKTWRNSSVKTNSYSETLGSANNGRYVRCVVTDKYGNSMKSNAAIMKITTLKITTQPANVSANYGATASFKVVANGSGLTYQWQLSDDQGKTWRNSKATGAYYSAALTNSTDGRYVRCIVTDKFGNKETSNAASMKISGIGIITQPANVTADKGATASFKVVAAGSGLTYQWQLSDDQGKTWRNSKATGAYYSAVLTDSNNGRYVRCIVTDKLGNQIISNAAFMKISAVKITAQPTSVTVKKGETASFKIKASGSGLTYQWQLSDDQGKTWRNSKATGAYYSAAVTDSNNGRYVRCIVTDKFGNKVTSNAAGMNIQ